MIGIVFSIVYVVIVEYIIGVEVGKLVSVVVFLVV